MHRPLRAATVLSTPNNLSEDYWSLRFSCDLFRPAKAANASTRIEIAIPNISFIRVQGGAPIQPADWVQLRALFMPHVTFLSGKHETEFSKTLNLSEAQHREFQNRLDAPNPQYMFIRTWDD